MRTVFEENLRILKNDILVMSSQTMQNYRMLLTAIAEKDARTFTRLMEEDGNINTMEREIENKCLSLITRQQPVAGDLRIITAGLKMVTDLERVAHHIADIAELSERLIQVDMEQYSANIFPMMARAGEIFSAAVASFTTRDMEEAKAIIGRDDEIDGLFNSVKNDLIASLRKSADSPDLPPETETAGSGKTDRTAPADGSFDSSTADICIDILMTAKYLEKMGDHAVNIAEWEIFQETGDMTHIM